MCDSNFGPAGLFSTDNWQSDQMLLAAEAYDPDQEEAETRDHREAMAEDYDADQFHVFDYVVTCTCGWCFQDWYETYGDATIRDIEFNCGPDIRQEHTKESPDCKDPKLTIEIINP